MTRAAPVLLFALLAWVLGAWCWSLASKGHGTMLPLDDAYIHLQYARTAAGGEPFAYQPGEGVSTGATSPLWLVPLTVGARFGDSVRVLPVVALLLNTLGVFLGFWMAWRIGRAWKVPAALAWIPAVCGASTLYWLFGMWNGMETGVYAAFLLAAVWVVRGGMVLWLAPLALLRPEGALVALGVLAWRFWRGPQPGTRSAVCVTACGAVMLALPWMLTGDAGAGLTAKALWLEPKPDTRAFYLERWAYFAGRGLWFGLSGLRHQPPLEIGIPLARPDAWPTWCWASFLGLGGGLALVRRTGRAALLLWALTSVASVMAIAWDAQGYRYLVPSFGLLALGAGAGWFGPGRMAGVRRAVGGALVLVAALGTLFGPTGVAERFPSYYRGECERLALAQAAAGDWAHETLPEGTRVAAHDVGALAFYGERPLVDLVGLVTPALAGAYRHGEGALWEALDALPVAERPSVAVIVPAWMPYLSRTFVFGDPLWRAGGSGNRDFAALPMLWPSDGGDRWPFGDFGNVPALHGEPAGRPEWHVVDAVDVADLDSEAAHDYREAGRPEETLVRDLGFPPGYGPGKGTHVIEGGRNVHDPSFVLRTEGSGDARLVIRTAAPRAGRFTVRVGAWSGVIPVPLDESRYAEPSVVIPEGALDAAREPSGRVRVELEGSSRVFHVWLLRRR